MKIMNFISYITLLLAAFIILLFTIWTVYPYRPVSVKNSIFPVINSTVKRGDTLQYLVDYCKYTDEMVTISRRFVDGIVFSTPEITSVNPKGCKNIIVGIQVPHGLPAGEYYLDITWKYKVNPIREVKVPLRTESFVVTD